MKLEELAAQLHETFIHNQWEFEGYGVPEHNDVQTFLENCLMHLQDKPDGTVLSVSNMSVRKDKGDEYEVFVSVGTFDTKE